MEQIFASFDQRLQDVENNSNNNNSKQSPYSLFVPYEQREADEKRFSEFYEKITEDTKDLIFLEAGKILQASVDLVETEVSKSQEVIIEDVQSKVLDSISDKVWPTLDSKLKESKKQFDQISD